MYTPFLDPHIATKLTASLVVVCLSLPLRKLALRRARSLGCGADGRQEMRLSRVRTVFGLLLTLALGTIWFTEIQSLIWSVTAVIVAFTIATKELIQCGTGALMRAAGRSFQVGDRMEIDGVYGEIVAHGILTTTILEIERAAGGTRATGRTIVLPNSRLFAADVCIDVRERQLVAHRFHVIFDPSVSTHAAVKVLEASLARYCLPFAAEVEAATATLGHLRAGELFLKPLVTLGTTDLARIRLDALCTVPATQAVALEREVKMEFLEWLWADAQARQLQAASGDQAALYAQPAAAIAA
ncbi:mechanosensitive ion channel family protein [Aurantimonas sp. MSK8Z-1]|uniref:mechanosensitive ion channel domain-containing protein n=1 Tax=Mangrovibrevibacter kandeliae TaxID=2968473 RepID=UPI0021193553|nr:mechanosensitive ion channel domain-containing protein [Aurantimonas sp. MSK8Z-1]MCW4115871.1 mechanosensitive ion channel family protein [Aurantimonas sp. MSK8Z-1]